MSLKVLTSFGCINLFDHVKSVGILKINKMLKSMATCRHRQLIYNYFEGVELITYQALLRDYCSDTSDASLCPNYMLSNWSTNYCSSNNSIRGRSLFPWRRSDLKADTCRMMLMMWPSCWVFTLIWWHGCGRLSSGYTNTTNSALYMLVWPCWMLCSTTISSLHYCHLNNLVLLLHQCCLI
jgi:hypothetical protein